ncbi:MAG: adenosylcobinamide-GDP ribazoletransferase [Methyloceanibacter sp.]|nr:adenosylcobinamide-GDP ribazoletransferase [Methyloceanibacter sp.]
MTTGGSIGGLITDLKTGLAFLTRLPLAHSARAEGADVARAGWTFPVIGALVGACGALTYWLADATGQHPFVSGVLALAATLLATGCLHEDGLVDMVDGFGGGGTADRKLEIMRDSVIGAYGASALVLSLMLRAGAIASLADPTLVTPALIAAHAGARATLPVFMRLVPRARLDGLAADAGRPPLGSTALAGVLGLIAVWLSLGLSGALIALLVVAAAAGLMAWLTLRQISGQTGDVLGALEQVSEILILLVAAAWL